MALLASREVIGVNWMEQLAPGPSSVTCRSLGRGVDISAQNLRTWADLLHPCPLSDA